MHANCYHQIDKIPRSIFSKKQSCHFLLAPTLHRPYNQPSADKKKSTGFLHRIYLDLAPFIRVMFDLGDSEAHEHMWRVSWSTINFRTVELYTDLHYTSTPTTLDPQSSFSSAFANLTSGAILVLEHSRSH